jgi:hypothetical protein
MDTNFEDLSDKINSIVLSSIIASACFRIISVTDTTLMVIN